MNDEILTELAAKSVGIEIDEKSGIPCVMHDRWQVLIAWTPLDCEEDALELASELCINMHFDSHQACAWVQRDHLHIKKYVSYSQLGFKKAKAMCRAIVNVAAEIGSKIKD